MTPEQNRKFFVVDKKVGIFLISLAFLMVGLQTYGLTRPPDVYGGCPVLLKRGIYNIPKDKGIAIADNIPFQNSQYYTVKLDRDKDGVACEVH